MATLTSLSTEGAPVTPSGMPTAPFHETRSGWALLAAVWAICAVYVGLHLRQGWWPSDAGTLGDMAARVLRGQVPARDFFEGYTGGLDYLNALAFRLFGENLFSMRIPLFLFFLGWVPSAYLVARRFVRPLAAGAIVLLAVAWSVPNYPEAMPSWYNLFFATWGVLALLRYIEGDESRWLWIAGICGGLSFLVKITGLYFAAAALLFLIFREQSLAMEGFTTEARRAERQVTGHRGQATANERGTGEAQRPRGGPAYRLFTSSGLLLFLAALADLVSQRPSLDNYVYSALPSACLVAILLWTLWRGPSPVSGGRFRRLFGMGLPFLAGFSIPIIPFLAWYFKQNALHAWAGGMFLSPPGRFLWAATNPVPTGLFLGLVPGALVLRVAGEAAPTAKRFARYGTPLLLGGLLVISWKKIPASYLLGESLPLLVPVVGIALAFGLRRLGPAAIVARQRIFLVVAAGVCCALIQFPFSLPLYFCYCEPLVLLAIVALLSAYPRLDRVAVGSLLGFYLICALWLGTPAYLELMHSAPGQRPVLRPLGLSRSGGLLVPASDAREYDRLVPLVREHARGRYTYCTPDCPELYFLSGGRDPMRSFWDFTSADFDYPWPRTLRVLQTLADHGVTVVVLNDDPVDSEPVLPALRAALRTRFPASRTVGRFEVRWR